MRPDAAQLGEDLVGLVSLLQGTESSPGFSRGNTLPLVARPWGLTHWAVQTRPDGSWWFDPKSPTLMGIRATRQPSPWMGDYGPFTVMAQAVGPRTDGGAALPARLSPQDRAAAYNKDTAKFGPDYVSVTLGDGVQMEMAPTERAAIFRFTFPSEQGRVVFDAHSFAEIVSGSKQINGISRRNSGGAGKDFGGYFVAVFDAPFSQGYLTEDYKRAENSPQKLDGKNVGVVAEFAARTVVLRVGTSFISHEQALRNLQAEIGDKTIDAVRAEGRSVWNEILNRVQIAGGTTEQRQTFYSCLYRAHLFPRMLHERDANGKTVHYSPYDGKIHDGVLYGDSGFWDTYRTLFPLLSLLQPDRLGEMIAGFINAYKEGGWLPQWPSPGYRAVMIGTHLDAVIADACVKNIKGFNKQDAWDAVWRDASVPGDPRDRFGRVGFTDYIEKGYVPADKFDKSASRALDYYYDDFCASQIAGLVGKKAEREVLRKRATGYRALYDPAIGFLWGKNSDGTWQKNFDEVAWGNPYVEGGPWQSTWAVPHDPAGLIALMGGSQPFRQKLDKLLYQPPTFKPGSYGGIIHEMLEMGAVQFGQYDHGNQPTHHILYLYTASGAPHKTQYWVRRVLDKLYSPRGFAGDEDNGEMAAWYIWGALGLYPLCPGHPSYVFGSPLFKRAQINVPGRKPLVIEAPQTSKQAVYANGVRWNNKAHSALHFAHADLARGGTLRFDVAARPVSRRFAPVDLPFSLSPYPKEAGANGSADPFGIHIKINCGGDAAQDFVGDCFFEGGSTAKFDTKIEGIQSEVPEAVYQTERWGTFTYRIPLPALPKGRSYKLRLFLAELADLEPGKRLMRMSVNGKRDIGVEGFDLFKERGANRATIMEKEEVLPDANGELVLVFSTTENSPDRNAKLSGIEIIG